MYQITRQHRKSIVIKIDEDLQVIIKAPYNVPLKMIEETYNKNLIWIENTIAKKMIAKQSRSWIEEGKIMYFGEYKNVHLIKSEKSNKSVKFIQDKFYIFTSDLDDQVTIKKQMETYYRQIAKNYLIRKTNDYCERMKCNYHQITLRHQKTRWGSCSSKGNLSYNVRIMCAPKQMIDYIVLHEVMHLIHFNHSKAFWNAIEKEMPDYKVRQKYFEQYGSQMNI